MSFRVRVATILGTVLFPVACSISLFSPCALQAQTPAPTYSLTRELRLPIRISQQTAASLSELKLYVKKAGGEWTFAQSAPPTQTTFDFRADKDGEYAFMFVTVDKMKRCTPAKLDSRPPHQVFVVDTVKPELGIQLLPVKNSDTYLKCVMIDPNADYSSIRMEYQTADGQWRSLELVKPDWPGVFQIPNKEVMQSIVRATAKDKAGNYAIRVMDMADPTQSLVVGSAPPVSGKEPVIPASNVVAPPVLQPPVVVPPVVVRQIVVPPVVETPVVVPEPGVKKTGPTQTQRKEPAPLPPTVAMDIVVPPVVTPVPGTKQTGFNPKVKSNDPNEITIPVVNSPSSYNPIGTNSGNAATDVIVPPADPKKSESRKVTPDPKVNPFLPIDIDTNLKRPDAPNVVTPPQPVDVVQPPVKPDVVSPPGRTDASQLPVLEANQPAHRNGNVQPEMKYFTVGATSSGSHRIINSTHCSLEYAVDNVFVGAKPTIEFWASRDSGRSWIRLKDESPGQSPAKLKLPGDGLYGIRVKANGNGQPPPDGEAPDGWVEVDTVLPSVKFKPPIVGSGPDGGTITIQWIAHDKNLVQDSISLYYSERPNEHWIPICHNVRNEGKYRWLLPPGLGSEIYLRIEATDRAGNVGWTHLTDPLALPQPKVRVLNIDRAP